jgi:hypothetical protein
MLNERSIYDYDVEGKTAKDTIFTESNLRSWISFSRQIPFYRLVDDIRYQNKDKDGNFYSREEVRDSIAIFSYCRGEEWYQRFIECFFVEAYELSYLLSDSWISPLDIHQFCQPYRKLFFVSDFIFRHADMSNTAKEVCEWYLDCGYFEKHPDDKAGTVETRYRIKHDIKPE